MSQVNTPTPKQSQWYTVDDNDTEEDKFLKHLIGVCKEDAPIKDKVGYIHQTHGWVFENYDSVEDLTKFVHLVVRALHPRKE